MTGLKFTNQDSSESLIATSAVEVSTEPTLAILDSGASCLNLPSAQHEFVIDYLISLLSFYEQDTEQTGDWGTMFYCSDKAKLPTISVRFGTYWLEMLADDYVVDFGNDICAFCIQ